MISFKLKKHFSIIVAIMATASFSGCSLFDTYTSGDGIDYKSTVKQKSLEVPPDLSMPTTNQSMTVPDIGNDANTYSAYHNQQATTPATTATAGGEPLAVQSEVSYHHLGPNSWLELKGTRAQVWPRIREFWLKNGFVLVQDQQEQGFMETEWAENRANIPKDFIRNALSKVFAAAYTSGTRDKFRLRIEEVPESNSIELYITHRGMTERVIGGELSSEGSVWEIRPSDPALEAEMLKRMMVHLGIESRQAESVLASTKTEKPKAELMKSGEDVSLLLQQDFSRAWRLVGLALDRVSFTVEDRDRSKGIYYVKYSDPDRTKKESGVFSSLKFWGDKKPGEEVLYQVTLTEDQQLVKVVVNDDKGARETSSTGERILNLLLEQLK